MDQFRTDLRRLFAEVDRSNRETDELLVRLETRKRALVKKDMTTSIIYKTVASDKTRGLEFVLSDATPDRYNDIILTSGWELENFKKNPIALFSHVGSFPVGTWKSVRVEDNALRGNLVLAKEGTSDRIDEIRKLVDAGILCAVSVGFTPLESEQRKGDEFGIIYKRQELVECSVVSVPANPSALVVAKKLNISDETQELVFTERAEKPVAVRQAPDGPLTKLTKKILGVIDQRTNEMLEVMDGKLVHELDGIIPV